MSESRLPLRQYRGVAWTLGGLLLALLSYVAYLAFVPPAEPIAHAEWPTIAKVPDQENAWPLYEKAIQELKRVEPAQYPDWLGYWDWDDAFGPTRLDQGHKAYLDRFAPALVHLMAGARRPRSQSYTQPPTTGENLVSIFDRQALARIAVAQVRRLELEGRRREAAALALATYRMGSDLAEGYAPRFTIEEGAQKIRGRAGRALYGWLNSGGADSATDRLVARQIAAMDGRMPTALQFHRWAWTLGDRMLEEQWVRSAYDQMGQGFQLDNVLFPYRAFRLRVYNNVMHRLHEMDTSLRPSLENWDFTGFHDAYQGFVTRYKAMELPEVHGYRYYFSLQPDTLAAGAVRIMLPDWDKSMEGLYRDRATGAAIQALAVCLAYRKVHGQFPVALQPAMAEANLPVPTDVATGKPIGYRLEHGQPVVWLAGFDRQDNGGKVDMPNLAGAPGTDLIYRLDQVPAVFARPPGRPSRKALHASKEYDKARSKKFFEAIQK